MCDTFKPLLVDLSVASCTGRSRCLHTPCLPAQRSLVRPSNGDSCHPRKTLRRIADPARPPRHAPAEPRRRKDDSLVGPSLCNSRSAAQGRTVSAPCASRPRNRPDCSPLGKCPQTATPTALVSLEAQCHPSRHTNRQSIRSTAQGGSPPARRIAARPCPGCPGLAL